MKARDHERMMVAEARRRLEAVKAAEERGARYWKGQSEQWEGIAETYSAATQDLEAVIRDLRARLAVHEGNPDAALDTAAEAARWADDPDRLLAELAEYAQRFPVPAFSR